MIILDTCVISEVIRPDPSVTVLDWIDGLMEDTVHVPALVLAELTRGIARLPPGVKQDALSLWLDQLEQRFEGRILSFDSACARTWGLLTARSESAGRQLPLMDSMIAALALTHQATLATRNTADFDNLGMLVVNPWGR